MSPKKAKQAPRLAKPVRLPGPKGVKVKATGVAYVICPIGEEGSDTRKRSDEILKFIVQPAVEPFGLRVDRSDKEPSPGNITTAIIKSLLEARVVIADLTGHNPNVFYELGVAHAFRRPVVMLNDEAKNQPFDVHNERAILLGGLGRVTLDDAERARGELRAALTVVLGEGYEAASVVSDVAQKQQLAALGARDPYAALLESFSSQLDSVAARLRLVENNTSAYVPSTVSISNTAPRWSSVLGHEPVVTVGSRFTMPTGPIVSGTLDIPLTFGASLPALEPMSAGNDEVLVSKSRARQTKQRKRAITR